jgi:hypothetical protein
MDKRTNRVQPIKLSPGFFPLDIHKSMFINELKISLPKYYVESWGEEIIQNHNKRNYKWDVNIDYTTPKIAKRKKFKFNAILFLSFPKDRSKESSYRLSWNNHFAIQLAKDYPKSFVRSLEFHIGDEYYKKKKYHEFDIGGFKEQLQVKIDWDNNLPRVKIKEFFRVNENAQEFPKIYEELSSYLIADYLTSNEDELLRRVRVSNWKKREELLREMHENNIYILLNRDKKEIYFGETKKSLSSRYPDAESHHSFPDWEEYSIIELPPETSNHTRQLIERVLIEAGAKIFKNNFNLQSIEDKEDSIKLVNKRK